MPILTKGDLFVVRCSRNYDEAEMRSVVTLAGDNAALLYNHYRNAVLYKDSERISDAYVSQALGWAEYKVSRYRRVLEKTGFIRIVYTNVNQRPEYKLLVGIETVALYDAKLPCNIVDVALFRKAMYRLNVTAATLPDNLEQVVAEARRVK